MAEIITALGEYDAEECGYWTNLKIEICPKLADFTREKITLKSNFWLLSMLDDNVDDDDDNVIMEGLLGCETVSFFASMRLSSR
jgi:hypothetical protein